MRCWLGLVALCACNQVFGLDGTRVAPAGDALPDAPPKCPMIGMTPAFSHPSTVVISNGCTAYYVSERHDFALADCNVVMQGPPDSTMLTAAMLPSSAYREPRLDPEGTAALFLQEDGGGAPLEWDVLGYDGATWANIMTLPMAAVSTGGDYYLAFGAPSRWASGAHVIAQRNDGALVEFAASGGNWSSGTVISTLGMSGAGLIGASLTPDGQRMVFSAPSGIYYSDRTSIDGTFGTATRIEVMGLPQDQVFAPFLTEDCGKLYYADTSGTVYVVAQ